MIDETQVRKLIALVQPVLEWNKDNPPIDIDICNKGLLALGTIEGLKKDLGLLEDRPSPKCKLKNRKLF